MGDDAGPEHHAVQGWYRSKRLEIRSSSIQNPFSSLDTSFDNDKRWFPLGLFSVRCNQMKGRASLPTGGQAYRYHLTKLFLAI